jgi:hypothetical protein
MKADTDIKKQALVVVEIPGLTTNTKGDNKKSTKEMADQSTENKDRCKLFKWEWKL